MYKNQLQELAQRSCFNFPSYACIREGPDHAPRFKASVNFNGEIFEGPSYSTTLRQAEHAAAQVAVNTLSARGPSKSLTARVLDETGVYKNLLQETAHRAGLNLPVYSTLRSGPGHVPVFTSTVELAGMNFTGESAKTKKQAEKNAALAAWSALKQMPNFGSSQLWTSKSPRSNDEQAQGVLKRVISDFKPKDEGKSIGQRDENQARRRMLSDSSGYSLQYKQLEPMKPLPDLSSICPLHLQNQKEKGVMALSKILPPTSSRDVSSNEPIPVQVTRSQVKIQEIPAPVEEQRHDHDEEEWMNRRSSSIDKSIESNSSCPSRQERPYRPVSISNNRKLSDSVDDYNNQQTQIRCRSFRHLTQSPTVSAPLRSTSSSTIVLPRINTNGFQQHCMAPAVHVRSAIPVYATPPIKKEASLQTLDRISGYAQTGETASSFISRSN